jgi:hypothetical protein
MGILDRLLSEPPIDDVLHEQLLFKGMSEAEAHAADDADGHSLFIHPLLGTDVTLHRSSSLGS